MTPARRGRYIPSLTLALSELQKIELERLARSRYANRLGYRVEESVDGTATVVLPMSEQILNRGGIVHGGAIASAALCSGVVAAAGDADSGAARVRPLSFTLSFLAPVQSDSMTFVARTRARGRSSVHVSIDARCGDRDIATALGTFRIETSGADSAARFAAGARSETAGDLPPVTISGSPYGSDAGIEILSEIGSEARVGLPVENNTDADGRIDPGAILGLVDNCGAFSAYSHPGTSIEQSGATISMNVTFGAPATGALRAVGRIAARTGSAFVSEIEVATREGHEVAAIGTVLYRLRAADRPDRLPHSRGGGEGA